jgi:hypothetical protein
MASESVYARWTHDLARWQRAVDAWLAGLEARRRAVS